MAPLQNALLPNNNNLYFLPEWRSANSQLDIEDKNNTGRDGHDRQRERESFSRLLSELEILEL